jgi:lipopolysaccharide transport system permease protein
VAATTAVRGRFTAQGNPGPSFWDLLFAVTARDMRVKYHGTFLSYFWWIARPLTMGLVLYFALNRVLQLEVTNHAGFLLSALFPWFWFSGTLMFSTSAFVGNAGLIKKVQFPRIVLPLSLVLGGLVEFVVTIPVMLGLLMITGVDPSVTWLAGIPALIVLQFALLCGLGIAASTLNVFVRDLTPALSSITTLLFYVTPIIYPLEQVPEEYQAILKLNPLVPLIDAWRNLLMGGEMPGIEIWPTVLFAVVSVGVAAWVLRAIGKDMADAL